MTFDETLVSVYDQALVHNLKIITLGRETYRVRTTAKQKLKQVDFVCERRELRGLEQNPNTKSRWAKMAKNGQKVMQFLAGGTYLAVVVDGRLHLYPGTKSA